ncbi:hypothetical protein PENTCL1PPCAC_11559 [Pristionchus entomophagus]|uniref:C2H2-type domain-containing protein n=1 Tax=Pristionchus entomophagus TaxID=358040 RepID=A0AAV5T6T8_9BILA|nr:hypothetical protein PENTCL1PPCAC_11559 [Pristionchus entomophagus]
MSSSSDEGFKGLCKESTLNKMRVMCQLTEAVHRDGAVKLSSLIPIANICSAIVKKDRRSFNQAVNAIRSCIDEKKEITTLQDLSLIAEINFLEGFDSFVQYIYQGPAEETMLGAVINTQSAVTPIQPSSSRRQISPKRRAPKKVDETKEDQPAKKSLDSQRHEQDEIMDIDNEKQEEEEDEEEKDEEKPVKPIRKSIRLIENDIKFHCVFNGCMDKFSTALELTAHADQCEHKSNLMLVFRCSVCKTSFSTDKAVKSHIGHINKCASATITIESETMSKPNGKNGEENVKSVTVSGSSMISRKSVGNLSGKRDSLKTQHLECPLKGCKYSNENPELIYVHVKTAHSDFNTIFKCLYCGETRTSGKAIKNHVAQICTQAKIELKIAKKNDDPENNKTPRRVVPLTRKDLSVQWDQDLCKCPIPSCEFKASAARHMAVHFKRNHSESAVSYQCSKCSIPNGSIVAMIAHCKKCARSRPEMMVVKKNRRGGLTRKSLPTPPMIMVEKRGPGRPRKRTEEDADMPVLEIEKGDEEDETMRCDVDEDVDVVGSSMDEQLVQIKEEENDGGDVFNMSDSDSVVSE